MLKQSLVNPKKRKRIADAVYKKMREKLVYLEGQEDLIREVVNNTLDVVVEGI